MSKKLMMIINPAAGRGLNKAALMDAIDVFDKNDYRVTIFTTRKRLDAEMFALEYGSGYDMIVCCGGDGTLSETVSGVVKLENAPPIGYIPMGSTNDVASTIGMPRAPVQAAEKIMSGKLLHLDIGEANGRFFTYIAAFGAFTEASYNTPQETKNALGHLAYMIHGAKAISQIQPITLTAEFEGKKVEGEFIFGSVSNSTSVAGLVKLSPELVALDDGMFEVLLIRKPNNVFQLERIINGIITKNYDEKYVEFISASKISFAFKEPVAWTMDGENGGSHMNVELVNHHGAVKLCIPGKE